MTRSTVHTLVVPLAVANRRMPAALVAGQSAVQLRALDRCSWRWESDAGGGVIRLSAAGSNATSMEVTVDEGARVAAADAVTVELYGALEGSWAPPAPPASHGPMRLRTKVLVTAAAVLVPLLAITGVRVLAPPKAMDVASAVEQFRQASTPTPAAETAAAADAGGGRGAASSADGRGRAQPADTQSAGTRSIQRRQSDGGFGRPAQTRAASARMDARATRSEASWEQPRGTQQAAPRRTQERKPAAPAIPEDGVYRYETTGYESIDKPSSRHDYPEETAMSIRSNDCGFQARWQPLESRWDEMTVCRDGNAMVIPAMGTHREFYGQAFDSRYECEPGYYAFRPEPGAAWSGRCSEAKSDMALRARNLGRVAVQVGSETVEAMHYVIEARITGETEGTWRGERWVDPDTGLVLRIESRTDASSESGVGTVNYHEEFTVQLLSTTPER